MIDCAARGWPAPMPILVPKPPLPTVTQHHVPSTIACCDMLIGNHGHHYPLSASLAEQALHPRPEAQPTLMKSRAQAVFGLKLP